MKSRQRSARQRVIGYTLSLLLVPVYVNMFWLWKLLDSSLGKTSMYILPFAATLAALAIIGTVTYRKCTTLSGSVTIPLVVAGSLLCLVALAVPDARFPVKRIHVVEYTVLSLVVRYSMATRLTGWPLLLCSALFTAILGIHDEFLQGFHPDRTYGLRDMTVNSLSACGSALIWHGMGLFAGSPSTAATTKGKRPPAPDLVYLCWLLTGIAALAYPQIFYRGEQLPPWSVMPLLSALVIYTLFSTRFTARYKHGIVAVSILSFSLLSYPVLTHVASCTFY